MLERSIRKGTKRLIRSRKVPLSGNGLHYQDQTWPLVRYGFCGAAPLTRFLPTRNSLIPRTELGVRDIRINSEAAVWLARLHGTRIAFIPAERTITNRLR